MLCACVAHVTIYIARNFLPFQCLFGQWQRQCPAMWAKNFAHTFFSLFWDTSLSLRVTRYTFFAVFFLINFSSVCQFHGINPWFRLMEWSHTKTSYPWFASGNYTKNDIVFSYAPFLFRNILPFRNIILEFRRNIVYLNLLTMLTQHMDDFEMDYWNCMWLVWVFELSFALILTHFHSKNNVQYILM